MERRLHITFIDKDGDEIKCEVAEGDNLLDIALEHDVEMEGTLPCFFAIGTTS